MSLRRRDEVKLVTSPGDFPKCIRGALCLDAVWSIGSTLIINKILALTCIQRVSEIRRNAYCSPSFLCVRARRIHCIVRQLGGDS